jgi:hypothetical protein
VRLSLLRRPVPLVPSSAQLSSRPLLKNRFLVSGLPCLPAAKGNVVKLRFVLRGVTPCERPWIDGWMAFFGIGCGSMHVEHCVEFFRMSVLFPVAVTSRLHAVLWKDQ